jgi:DNA-binding NarL/FixJ family response regulator
MLSDLVEAAVRAGRMDDAATHVADIRAARLAEISPRLAVVAAGAEALLLPGADAVSAFETAIAIPGANGWPFLLARIRFAYGERLRRLKATDDARRQLSTAIEAFEALGAAPWAARARNELRATGLAAKPTTEALTPQERQIADLAATGLTNKQIGERLFLSPRTVSAHLYHLFPKLGVTSRAALAHALRNIGA